MGIRFLVLFALLCVGLQVGAQSQPVEFPQLGMAIEQPAGFERAQKFHGFQQRSSGASVMLTLIPGPFQEVTAEFTREGLASRGMRLRSSEPIRIQDKPGMLLNVAQSAEGQEYQKWIVVFGDRTGTRMATATFPVATASQLSAPLRSVVMRVSSREAVQPKEPEPLPFSIAVADGLVRAVGAGVVGKLAAFNRDGKIPQSRVEDPLFVVGPSLAEVAVQDRRMFAEQRLRATASTRIESIRLVNDVTIDGLPGYEFVAAGVDDRSGALLAVYQVMLFQPAGGYVLMTGLVGRSEATQYLLKFRAMARSYRGRPG